MKKKIYKKPEILLLAMEVAELIAYSGGSESAGVTINGEEADYDETADNRSRGFWGSSDEVW